MSKELSVTVVIATYNMPHWLEKVLWGYEHQTYRNFDIIIADDGSGEETRAVVDRFKKDSDLSITHLWHEDKGYRRQTILNKAIEAARSEYILFTDGDCIPREDFIATHVALAERGHFLSGGYCKLPMGISEGIDKDDIFSGQCFSPEWLKERDFHGRSQLRKLSASPQWGRFLDFVTPANASFNNCNTSVWKEDLLAVNGYDERMQYGGPDRELGERLENKGIRGKQIRHRAICIHLDHARGYKTKESLERNLRIRKDTRRKKLTWTDHGIAQKVPSEAGN